MATEEVKALSQVYGTNLQTQIDSYDRLVDRITYSLGYPLVNVEAHKNMIYEYISIASEMFTKYAGYTQEYLIFDSNLYEKGKGIRLDKLFAITPELKSSYTSADVSISEVNPRANTVTVTPDASAVVYSYMINDSAADPTEFGLKFVDEETNHTRVSKMLIATQFNEGAGSATLTEYGIIYTSSSDIASFQVALSGLSGERIAVVIDPSVAGTATAVALDTFTSSINTLSAQQQTMRGYDMLTNNYRKVVDCFGFEEGSTTGVNTLFTIEQTLAQQTYFAYSMGNYGFDLISWYVVKEFLETRAKLLSQRRSYKFDPRTQYLQMYPHVDTDTARFYGVVGCYLEQPLVEVIKEPWVYQYALALTKIGVARVRGKYGGTNLFGGGTIEYDSLLSEGNETKDKLEQQLFEGSAPGFGDAMPPMFFVG